MSLADERKVTEKLSRNLEVTDFLTHLVYYKVLINQITSSLSFLYKKLEKRRSESLEQKVKGTHRRSVGGTGGSSNSGEATKSELVVNKQFFPQF